MSRLGRKYGYRLDELVEISKGLGRCTEQEFYAAAMEAERELGAQAPTESTHLLAQAIDTLAQKHLRTQGRRFETCTEEQYLATIDEAQRKLGISDRGLS